MLCLPKILPLLTISSIALAGFSWSLNYQPLQEETQDPIPPQYSQQLKPAPTSASAQSTRTFNSIQVTKSIATDGGRRKETFLVFPPSNGWTTIIKFTTKINFYEMLDQGIYEYSVKSDGSEILTIESMDQIISVTPYTNWANVVSKKQLDIQVTNK